MTSTRGEGRFDLRSLLRAIEAVEPMDSVGVLAQQLVAMVGAEDVSFLIADFTGGAVVRFARSTGGTLSLADQSSFEAVPLDGTPHGRVMRSQTVELVPEGERCRVYAPVTNRGDALGVLEMTLPARPDDDEIRSVTSAAHALGYVVVADRRHTDLFERGQRNEPFSLAAEIQRRLLPPAYTLEGGQFTLAGWLEPASRIGGDTFDYVLDRDALHVSITDAMGHLVPAAQLAGIVVGSLRNTRRGRSSLVEQATAANAAVLEHAFLDQYVTGQLIRIDLRSHEGGFVNAGHPGPFRVRAGRAESLPMKTELPFGILPDTRYTEQPIDLRPGDRLVFLTDGMLERNAQDLDIVGALEGGVHLHPREVVHELAGAVLASVDGELLDDATVVCIDWHGNGDRSATGGTASPL